MFDKFFLGRDRARAKKEAQKFLTTPIKELMTNYVVTTKPEVNVVQAATRMIAQNVSCIVVVDKDDARRPVGIVTERDYLRKVPANSTALKKTVGDIMTPKVVTISPEQTLQEAYALMRKHSFRKVIVTVDDHLTGILTQTDVVKYGAKMMTRFAASKDGVSHWMTKNVVLIGPNVSFAEAKKLMVAKDIGAIVVKGKEYEGIFTEYDVVAQFYDQGGMLQIKSPKEIMHPHIRSINVNHSIPLANRIMLEKNVRRLLVVDDTKVVGIITQTDIADAFVEMAQELINDEFLAKQKSFERPTKDPIEVTFVNGNLKVYHLVKK